MRRPRLASALSVLAISGWSAPRKATLERGDPRVRGKGRLRFPSTRAALDPALPPIFSPTSALDS